MVTTHAGEVAEIVDCFEADWHRQPFDRGDAGVEEGGHQVGGYPPSDLLDDDRDLEGGTERFDPAEEPGEAGVALGL